MKMNYFNFKKIEGKYLLTNDLGSYLFVTPTEFQEVLQKKVCSDSPLGKQLLNKNMAYEITNLEYSANHKSDVHRIKGHVSMATSLHIFVVTTACNMRCVYCQANNGTSASTLYMNEEMAEKAVDIALQSPTTHLNFEFQGGEPLLNFKIIKHIVEYADSKKGNHEIQYNVVSNLTLINDEMIDFFVEHNFGISTSIDGPELVHNANRQFAEGKGTFYQVTKAIENVRGRGLHVGAIQTTTRTSLSYPKEIINAYFSLGFDSVFIRPLTPLGKASLNWNDIGYSAAEFLEFYYAALDEVIHINKTKGYIKENHAGILLSRIGGNFVNYMELRSPCGAGIGQIAYYADGNIFTCDEGRMLHEMGDSSFKLGNVFENSFSDVMNSGVCKAVCASSILESIPSCCDCVYQPYCGTCPVVNYANSKDIMEKEPRGYRCKIYSGMLDYLFTQLLNDNPDVIDIFRKWSN